MTLQAEIEEQRKAIEELTIFSKEISELVGCLGVMLMHQRIANKELLKLLETMCPHPALLKNLKNRLELVSVNEEQYKKILEEEALNEEERKAG